ncbi:hypothetical protein D3C71_1961260 [compost metagenome]
MISMLLRRSLRGGQALEGKEDWDRDHADPHEVHVFVPADHYAQDRGWCVKPLTLLIGRASRLISTSLST